MGTPGRSRNPRLPGAGPAGSEYLPRWVKSSCRSSMLAFLVCLIACLQTGLERAAGRSAQLGRPASSEARITQAALPSKPLQSLPGQPRTSAAPPRDPAKFPGPATAKAGQPARPSGPAAQKGAPPSQVLLQPGRGGGPLPRPLGGVRPPPQFQILGTNLQFPPQMIAKDQLLGPLHLVESSGMLHLASGDPGTRTAIQAALRLPGSAALMAPVSSEPSFALSWPFGLEAQEMLLRVRYRGAASKVPTEGPPADASRSYEEDACSQAAEEQQVADGC